MEETAVSGLMDKVRKDGVKFVDLWFTDFFGHVKSTTIMIERLPDALEKGVWFDGSSIQGFARIHESDMVLRPDASTYALLPWRPMEKATARLICDVHNPDGTPFPGDPRHILKKAIDEARKMGFAYNTGPECEFFLFRAEGENGNMKPVLHDSASYFDLAPRDMASDVRRNIVFALEEMGMEVEMSHHEVAPGQHEIDVKYSDALTSADNTITLKTATKAVAHGMGLQATFMPKPIFGENGSGMHVHQSLFDTNGKNVFYDERDKYRLSDTAKHFIAGQLSHVREMSAVLAPTVNSYKRLVPGYEAPVYISWARINRSALIRVPQFSPGREQSTRAELRCPDPSCNPYLAFAAMLTAGLEGIRNKTPLKDPVEENLYHFDDEKLSQLKIATLPASLKEALDEFAGSAVMKRALGEKTFKEYLEAKLAEWDEFRITVTEWEKKKYFDLL